LTGFINVVYATFVVVFLTANFAAVAYLRRVYRSDPRWPNGSWLLRMIWVTSAMVLVAAVWFTGLTLYRLYVAVDLPVWTRYVSGVMIFVLLATPLYKAHTVRGVRRWRAFPPPTDRD
jgi:sterol desaturase/sphingolipid hydroxylase (fatty acid hydroxylase superfamily)